MKVYFWTEFNAQRGSRHRHRDALEIEGSRMTFSCTFPGFTGRTVSAAGGTIGKLRAHRELMATVQILRESENVTRTSAVEPTRGRTRHHPQPYIDFYRTGAVSIAGYQLVTLIVVARYIKLTARLGLTRGSVINRHRVNVVPQVNLG